MSVKPNFGGKDLPLVFKGDKLVYPNPVKDGLVLWYDFAGMRNTDINRDAAKDLSGNGNDGTLRNFAYNSNSGYDKNHLLFDGIDDYLEVWRNLLVLEGKETLRSYTNYNSNWVINGSKIQTEINSDSLNLTLHKQELNAVVDPETNVVVSGFIRVNGEIPTNNIFTDNRISTLVSTITKKFKYDSSSGFFSTTLIYSDTSWIFHSRTSLSVGDVLEIEDLKVHKTLDENAATVQVGDKIYAYDGDKVVTVGEDGSVEAGGRNYVQNSFKKMEINSEYKGKPLYVDTIKEFVGNTVTVSFEAKLHEDDVSNEASIRTYFRGGNPTVYFSPENITISDEWVRYSRSMEITESIGQSENTQIAFHFNFAGGVHGYVRKIKLEKGNKATDWTPAPEDFLQTNITHSPLRKLKYYNRPLVKSELLSNAEKEENKQLKEGVPVQDGLVLHYDFSNESNTSEYREKAFDYSGNGNHGELQNFNYTSESGYENDGLKFDGVDDGIVTPSVPLIDGLTVQTTFTLYGAPSTYPPIFRIHDERGVFFLGFNSPSTGGLWVGTNGDEGVIQHTGIYTLPINEKINLSVVYNGSLSTIEIYINSVKVTEISHDILPLNYNGDLFIARQADNASRVMEADYNSLLYYNRPLTEEEIAHNYAIEKERFGIE